MPTKHGLRAAGSRHSHQGQHPLYAAWQNIRQRCRNPRHPRYKDYGGRGIHFWSGWDDFAKFVADLGPRPGLNYSIDRINNGWGYFPGNVKWSTAAEQRANQYRAPWPFGVLARDKTQGFEADHDAWAEEQQEREAYEEMLRLAARSCGLEEDDVAEATAWAS